ncbi:MAG: hypothetical protein H7122_14875 [Chitinophagaceae bacterium]|nr:hypothetical protein [Chitinophagaceae bacterium]
MATIISGNGTLLDKPKFSPVTKFLAHFFSWIFHPLFIPVYVTIFLLYIHPYAFVALSEKMKVFKLLFVLVNTTLFPAFAVFLMWRLRLTQSIFLQTQKERIIPYAAAMIFYFWAWYVSRSQQDNHEVFTGFLLGSFLTVIAAWLANIYFKISMHALAIGGMLFFILWVSFSGDGTSGLYPSFAILIAGIVCTARMIISDHRPVEIYAGILIGIVCQIVAVFV